MGNEMECAQILVGEMKVAEEQSSSSATLLHFDAIILAILRFLRIDGSIVSGQNRLAGIENLRMPWEKYYYPCLR